MKKSLGFSCEGEGEESAGGSTESKLLREEEVVSGKRYEGELVLVDSNDGKGEAEENDLKDDSTENGVTPEEDEAVGAVGDLV